ncbi:TatD family deoxyribonuclease [bacterium]|jgi:TatD DNase family protein|nr:TatD family deoxyribonuclease [bacterium]
MLHDAHNHLQDEALVPHLDRIAVAWTGLAGVGGEMVVNGTHPDDWPRVAALVAAHTFVRPAYGLHPWDVGAPRPADWRERLAARLDADPRASVGEIGLDRWILDSASPDDPRLGGVRPASIDEQTEAFVAQFALAASRSLPVTIHCLHAFGELLPLLRELPVPKHGFLLHAYGGSAEMVPELVELGAYFSFNPAFLDRRKSARQDAFRVIPEDRLLCETDAPAMPPPPVWRAHKLPSGSDGFAPNHPGNIEAAYAGLATLRGVAEAALAAQIAENFTRFFGPAR